MRVRGMAAVLLGAGLLACSAESDGTDTETGTDTEGYDLSRVVNSDGGSYTLSYAPDPDPIPPVSNFALLLTLTDSASGDPVLGADLELDATMPEHNHGMNTQPPVTEENGGEYRVDGMQFHMSGHWQMEFQIRKDDVVETAVFHAVCCE